MAEKKARVMIEFDVTWNPEDDAPPSLSEIESFVAVTIEGEQQDDDPWLVDTETVRASNAAAHYVELD